MVGKGSPLPLSVPLSVPPNGSHMYQSTAWMTDSDFRYRLFSKVKVHLDNRFPLLSLSERWIVYLNPFILDSLFLKTAASMLTRPKSSAIG